MASVVHSLADFVWYIPSLMAITVLLMACALRLAQWSTVAKKPAVESSSSRSAVWSPWQCGLAALTVALVGPWMIYDRFCAAMAEPHWDQYLMYALDGRSDKKPADRVNVRAPRFGAVLDPRQREGARSPGEPAGNAVRTVAAAVGQRHAAATGLRGGVRFS